MINPADPSDMRSMIENFPGQFAAGSSWAANIEIDQQINRIVVTGMGGSALPTDLVNAVFRADLKQPIILNRSYQLDPYLLTPDTLVIACSFSGNTEETISAYHQAIVANMPTVAIAGGGELIQIAKQNNLPYVQLIKPTPDFQPRMGSGFFFGAIAQILFQARWISTERLQDVLNQAQQLDPTQLEPAGRELANIIGDRIPVFYTSDQYWPVARIAKIKINENSKLPAFWNYLPEANHNEMVGYSQPNGNYIAICFIDQSEDPRINRRFAIMTQLLHEKVEIPHYNHQMIGTSTFTKIFNTLCLCDWASYHKALSAGIDPTPVAMVEDFKQLVVK